MSDDKTWSGWASKKYKDNYNAYVPWLEDKYLQWYGENKTSYTAKDTLKKNPLTDDKNVAAIQGGVAEGVGGQLSSGGLLGGIGDLSSKEGVNRVERGEMDPSKLEDIKKKEQNQKEWTETLTGGYIGGSGEKK